MKNLYIHNDYASPSGEEHAASAISDLLTSKGHEVVWFRRSSTEIAGSMAGNAKAFFTGIHNPFAARALARMLDAIKPDLVQVQNIYPLLSPAIFKVISVRRIPMVMRCPNYRLFCPNGLHYVNGKICERCLGKGRELWCVAKNCEKNLVKSTGYALRNAWARISGSIIENVDMFIVQTAFQKQKFVANGITEGRIGVVSGLTHFSECSTASASGQFISFIGRVSEEKGVSDFLEAARLLPDLSFAIAGSDAAMPGIREQSPANVKWLGFLDTDRLQTLYQDSRIVVVASRWYEGFPNVLVQAMSQGRAIVAANVGAMASIINDKENGLLFTPGDARDLADKIQQLYTNSQLCKRLGEAGRSDARAKYSPERVYEQLSEVYEKAIQNCRKREGEC